MTEAPREAPRPITHRRVLAIAMPIVFSNATVPILGAVDTGVVGQMGLAAPIGAVGVGAVVLSAIYWIFGFLRMGTTGLAAQAIGAEDSRENAALLFRALAIALAGGLGIILLQWPLFWAAFQLSPASAEVEGLARSYMGIRVWSAPAAIAIYGITGWLIAQERTLAVVVIQLWMNCANIVLDLVFVLGFGWGVEGVALATVIAEVSGAALGLWLCSASFAGVHWRDRARIFDPERLRHMMSVNTDILLRSLMLQAIFLSFLLLGAKFGDVTLAANQILLQFLYITAYALDGFAFAAEALVGNAMGRRAPDRLRRAAIMSSFWGGLTVIGLALTFAMAGGLIIDVMTNAQEVRIESRGYLFWMVAAPIAGVAAWMLDGVFIGATRSRDMRNMMALSLLAYVLAVWALVPLLGNHGLWAALLISFLARGITLGARYPALERAARA